MHYKHIYGIAVFWVMGASLIQTGYAQNARLSRFTASPVAEKVLLDWVVAAGATCDGIGVYRGNDTVGMSLIHYIPGVCGDLARPVTYNYVDSFPLANQKNYYRLELGPRIFTAPISISLVNVGKSGYQFRPHPVTTEAQLFLEGDEFITYSLRLYDFQGKLRLATSFSGNQVVFPTHDFENGIYLFTLAGQDGRRIRHGKMIVQR